MAQLPNTSQQRYVRISRGGECGKSREQLFAAMRIDTPARSQVSKGTRYFHIKQMRNNERVAASGQIVSEGCGQWAVCEEFHDYGRIQNNHFASRNRRTTCAALRFDGIGLAPWVCSNHSRIVGCSTVRSNSFLR